jgi:multiple sugar transport system ATP-binding protein
MHDGVLQQVGTPDEVYLSPANLFVAQFIGSPVMNVSTAAVSEADGAALVKLGDAAESFALPRELLGQLDARKTTRDLSLGVRPEGVLISREAAPGYQPVEAHLIEPFGPYDIVDLKLGSRFLRARTASGFVGQAGEKVWARIDPAQAHFFDSTSGASLGIRLE